MPMNMPMNVSFVLRIWVAMIISHEYNDNFDKFSVEYRGRLFASGNILNHYIFEVFFGKWSL